MSPQLEAMRAGREAAAARRRADRITAIQAYTSWVKAESRAYAAYLAAPEDQRAVLRERWSMLMEQIPPIPTDAAYADVQRHVTFA